MMNLFQRCWQKRWIRGLVWTAVTIVTLYALLAAWVNWSGARQWRATQAMLKAEGESLDFRAVASEPIADAENFCAIPLLKDLSLVVDNDANKGTPGERRKRLEALKMPSEGKGGARPKLTNAMLARCADLKVWAEWLRQDGPMPMPADSGDAAREVLSALSKHDAVMRELAAGLNRPGAQWTPAWKTRELPAMLLSITLPHYSILMGLNQTLSLRAIAAARAGDAAGAHESALVIARINQACLDEPMLIGLLFGASGVAVLHGTVWEICDAQAGTVEDFTNLESALASLDFRSAMLQAWRGELASSVDTMQFIKRSHDIPAGISVIPSSDSHAFRVLVNLAVRAIPLGLIDSNCAVLAERELRYLIKPMRDQGWSAVFESAQEWDEEIIEMKKDFWLHPSYLLASLFAPAGKSVAFRAAYSQVLVNQAMIACALERYRIEHGNYPDALNAVTLANGKPLPLDVMNGKPMNYRKTAEGKYALWSVGFDGKDDDGKQVLDEKKPENTKFHAPTYTGDWVWAFPEK